MTEEINEFSFRLYGHNISPETFKASEVAKLITLLENAFQVYFNTTTDNSSKDFYLSLVDVKNESLGLKFSPQKIKSFFTAFALFTSSIETQDFTNLPTKSIQDFQEIQKIVRAKNCTAEFVYQGETLASIDSNTKIAVPKTGVLRGETTLYGEVKRVGGKNPSAAIELDSGETITCNLTKALAKRLGAKLYSNVALKGIATWRITDYQILDFSIEEFNDIRKGSNQEAMTRLSQSLGSYWDGIDDIDNFLLKS